MAPYESLKSRKREDYPFHLDYRTRWSDNDMYGHMNNSVYTFLFDSIINAYLVRHCGFNPQRREPQYGLLVHSHTDFFSSIAFPEVAELALRVAHIGRTSVHYEIALFSQGIPLVRAVGCFVQVWLDRVTDQPSQKDGIHPTLRRGLERILVRLPGDEDTDSPKSPTGPVALLGPIGLGPGRGRALGPAADLDAAETSSAIVRRGGLSKL